MKRKITTVEDGKLLTKNGILPATAQGMYVTGGDEIPYWTFEGLYQKIPSVIYDKENHRQSVVLVKKDGKSRYVVLRKNKEKCVISESEDLMRATVDCVLWLLRGGYIPKEPEYRDFTSVRQSQELMNCGLLKETASEIDENGIPHWTFDELWNMLPSEFESNGECFIPQMKQEEYNTEKSVLVYYVGQNTIHLTTKMFFSGWFTPIDALVNVVRQMLEVKCIDGKCNWVGF